MTSQERDRVVRIPSPLMDMKDGALQALRLTTLMTSLQAVVLNQIRSLEQTHESSHPSISKHSTYPKISAHKNVSNTSAHLKHFNTCQDISKFVRNIKSDRNISKDIHIYQITSKHIKHSNHIKHIKTYQLDESYSVVNSGATISPLRISLNTSFEESGHGQHGYFLHQTKRFDGNAEGPEYTIYGLHETL